MRSNMAVQLQVKIYDLQNKLVDLEELVKVSPSEDHVNDLMITQDLIEMAQEDMEEII